MFIPREFTPVNTSHALREARDIEIEKSFTYDPRFRGVVTDHLKSIDIDLHRVVTHTLYGDTTNQCLLKRGNASLRFREGGRATCGETYPSVVGIKRIHQRFQDLADTILAAQLNNALPAGLPDLGPEDNARVRQEIEREMDRRGKWLTNRTFVHGADLPKEIRKRIAKMLGASSKTMNRMRFFPQFSTVVDPRCKFKVYFKPWELIKKDRIVPFHEMIFAADKPQGNGYVCIEMVFDPCLFKFHQGFVPDTLVQLAETEVVAKHSSVNDNELILGDAFFRRSLRETDAILAAQFGGDYKKMAETPPKAAIGFSLMQRASSFAHKIA